MSLRARLRAECSWWPIYAGLALFWALWSLISPLLTRAAR